MKQIEVVVAIIQKDGRIFTTRSGYGERKDWREFQGDLEEAVNAAQKIGDDYLQKQARGTVTPESFTHGTSVQRVRWLKKGLTTGDMTKGDTFSPAYNSL